MNAFGRRGDLPYGSGDGALGRRPIVPKSASEALRPEQATPPPRRSRRARSQPVVFLNFILSSAVFLALLGGVAVWFGKREFDRPGPLQAPTTFIVEPSDGVARIATRLENQKIITESRVFRYGVQAYGNEKSLKAGEYEVKAGASMRDIMDLLKSGKSVLYALTIPEGLTVQQAFQKIAADPVLEGEMPAEIPPEGSLQAETHKFTRGTTRTQAIEKLILDQQKMVEDIWAKRRPDLPLADMNEFLTLASIVEKETSIPDERTRVAAVFVNRLRKGMRLQSDPTIIYGLFGGQGKPPERAILKSDLEKETAYNTYLIDGLPPTPIAIPGREALEAVANPSQTGDLYFVADGSGGHAFAETLDDHNENVKRWRAIEKKMKQDAADSETGAVEPQPSQ